MRTGGIGLAVWFTACSAHAPPRPPELGDCVTSDDAACATPAVGGGSATVGGDSSLAAGQGSTSDAPSCGAADSLVTTNNGYCHPCIVASCCSADQFCDRQCQLILQCTQGCTAGDLQCAGLCENQWPAGLTAYLDLADCVSQSCLACPRLQRQ